MPEYRHPQHMRRHLEQDIAGVPLRDWYTLADLILANEEALMNANDPLPIYRSIKRDARLTEPNMIKRQHMDLVRALVSKGRRFAAGGE